jgi:hypothetical protein
MFAQHVADRSALDGARAVEEVAAWVAEAARAARAGSGQPRHAPDAVNTVSVSFSRLGIEPQPKGRDLLPRPRKCTETSECYYTKMDESD